MTTTVGYLALSLMSCDCPRVADRSTWPQAPRLVWLGTYPPGRGLHPSGWLVSTKTATKQPQGSGRLTTAADRRGIHPADPGVTPRHSSGLADLAAVGGPTQTRGERDVRQAEHESVHGLRPASDLARPKGANQHAAVIAGRDASSPHKENDHSCHADNGGLAGRPHVRPGGKVGNLEAAFGRDGFAVCSGRSRTQTSRPTLACALPGSSGGQLVRVPLEPACGRRRLARLVPVPAVYVGAHPVRGPFDLRPVRVGFGGGVASEKGRWLV